jgi:hypothetical protein
MFFACFQPPTPSPADNEYHSNTGFTNYIENIADNNDQELPEIWSPELWHPDSRTGKIRKRRLENEEQLSGEEPTGIITEPEPPTEIITEPEPPTGIITEPEAPTSTLPPSALLTVEEEESDIEADNSALFS